MTEHHPRNTPCSCAGVVVPSGTTFTPAALGPAVLCLCLIGCNQFGLGMSADTTTATIAPSTPVSVPPVITPTPPITPPEPMTGIGGIWTAGGDMLFTSPVDAITAWSGPVNVYGECVAGELGMAAGILTGSANVSDATCGVSGDISGNITPGVSLTLAGNTWQFDPLYLNRSSLGLIAGNWVLPDSSILAIQNGVITADNLPPQSAGCTVAGIVTIIDSHYNLYGFQISWTDCPSGAEENNSTWSGFLALDGDTLIGGGVINNGSGGASNQALFATTE